MSANAPTAVLDRRNVRSLINPKDTLQCYIGMTFPEFRLPAPERDPPRVPRIQRLIAICAVLKPGTVVRTA
jgi:hypothetical protein